MEQFAYFTIRVRLPDVAGSEPTGVVERLDTCEKKTFGSRVELLQLMTEWSGPVAQDAGRAEDGQS